MLLCIIIFIMFYSSLLRLNPWSILYILLCMCIYIYYVRMYIYIYVYLYFYYACIYLNVRMYIYVYIADGPPFGSIQTARSTSGFVFGDMRAPQHGQLEGLLQMSVESSTLLPRMAVEGEWQRNMVWERRPLPNTSPDACSRIAVSQIKLRQICKPTINTWKNPNLVIDDAVVGKFKLM